MPLIINHLGQQFGQSDSVLSEQAEPSLQKARLVRARHKESQAAHCRKAAGGSRWHGWKGQAEHTCPHTQHLLRAPGTQTISGSRLATVPLGTAGPLTHHSLLIAYFTSSLSGEKAGNQTKGWEQGGDALLFIVAVRTHGCQEPARAAAPYQVPG